MRQNGWAESERFMTTTALTYLRVSSTKQLRPDLGPEGLSIPAQRAACEATAREHGIEIVEEFVEPGRSGTTITARPARQSVLKRSADNPTKCNARVDANPLPAILTVAGGRCPVLVTYPPTGPSRGFRTGHRPSQWITLLADLRRRGGSCQSHNAPHRRQGRESLRRRPPFRSSARGGDDSPSPQHPQDWPPSMRRLRG
ncbi:Resolvase, N terminal domain [Clostridioides difficile]|nr:Resolvase, N terminal domain [Clostridioides difficile]